MARDGNHAIIEQFLADGMSRMFGNPGTVEQGFLHAADSYEDFSYILSLQETVAAGIADGYARATGGPALLQVHSGVGLGNAIGMLYQANRGHTPLVVVAGEAGIGYDAMDAQMASDLVAMARPVTKHAMRVIDPRSVLRTVRRAVKMAMTPPRGPVFVALPADVLDQPNDEPVRPTSIPRTAAAPRPDLVREAARLLSGARSPIILIGDGISTSGAQEELTQVAELLGADVWGVEFSEANFDGRHPLFRGQLGHMFGQVSTDVVKDADAVLVAGTYLFPEVFPALSSPFAEGTPIVHIDLDAYQIAKNHPVTLGLVADPKETLGAVAAELTRTMGSAEKDAALSRIVRRSAETSRGIEDGLLRQFMEQLAAEVPEDVIVFDEGLTASGVIGAYFPPGRPGHWFSTRGGSLGVGIPGAIGAKLAHPGKTVIGFTGDGGSMYTFQALATAARHNIAAKFVICNNHSYRLLDNNIEEYWRRRGIDDAAYPGCFDLSRPDIQFADLARACGVEGTRVEKPDQVEDAVARMLERDEPFLIDLVTEPGGAL